MERLPLDILSALQGDMPAVAAALAWVTRLLWFAPRDTANIITEHMEAVKSALASLRRRAQLQPSNANFTTAAFIVRALLDELLPRLGMDITAAMQPGTEPEGKPNSRPQSPSVIPEITSSEAIGHPQSPAVIREAFNGASWAGANGDSSSLSHHARTGTEQHGLASGEAKVEGSSAAADSVDPALRQREGREIDGQPGSWLLDQRVLQLCCPQLDAARQAVQVMLPSHVSRFKQTSFPRAGAPGDASLPGFMVQTNLTSKGNPPGDASIPCFTVQTNVTSEGWRCR